MQRRVTIFTCRLLLQNTEVKSCQMLTVHFFSLIIARCKAGYVSSLLVWPRYGHVPDNELDSDWTGLVVLFSDMHPRCMDSKPFSSITRRADP